MLLRRDGTKLMFCLSTGLFGGVTLLCFQGTAVAANGDPDVISLMSAAAYKSLLVLVPGLVVAWLRPSTAASLQWLLLLPLDHAVTSRLLLSDGGSSASARSRESSARERPSRVERRRSARATPTARSGSSGLASNERRRSRQSASLQQVSAAQQAGRMFPAHSLPREGSPAAMYQPCCTSQCSRRRYRLTRLNRQWHEIAVAAVGAAM
eukprot:364743-Chlamydomonas_euryale.AAC.56